MFLTWPVRFDGHEVDVVGEILPGAGDARDLRLPAQLAVGAHLASHARYFARERIQLVHHGVDGVFQFENLALHIDRDLAGQVAARHGCGHFGNVSYLCREVAGHRVDRVGEILPRSGDARHVGLTAEPAFRSYFTGHARHFAGEPVELIHHRVQRFFQLQNFAAHIDGDFAGKVAIGDGSCYFGDVTNLAGQVAGHEVHIVREILPCSSDAWNVGLATEFAFRSHFAGHARHFAGEGIQLVNHRVDGVLQGEDFALHVHRDLARQVTAGYRCRDFGDVSHLGRQVAGHGVH